MSIKITNLSVSLSHREVLHDVTADLPEGRVTGLIGPNGCGKTTLLRSIAGLLPVTAGAVTWRSRAFSDLPVRARARQIALLPQSAQTPAGITVAQLVAKGRSPYLRPFRALSALDRDAVARAMEDMGVADLAQTAVETLSGGQRQRVWIAMILAQDTQVVLLDEPINFLDLPHQIEVLRHVRHLSRAHGKTVAMVLHDLNYASRFCDHLIALKDGHVNAAGPTETVLTEDLIWDVFDVDCHIWRDQKSGMPLVVPTPPDPETGVA